MRKGGLQGLTALVGSLCRFAWRSERSRDWVQRISAVSLLLQISRLLSISGHYICCGFTDAQQNRYNELPYCTSLHPRRTIPTSCLPRPYRLPCRALQPQPLLADAARSSTGGMDVHNIFCRPPAPALLFFLSLPSWCSSFFDRQPIPAPHLQY